MPLEIFEYADYPQGSPEWKALKAGVPSSSKFKAILATSAEMKMRTGYLHKLAGEIITGEYEEEYESPHMKDGARVEDELRLKYALHTNTEPRRIAFAKNHGVGASTDALIGDDGILEIKRAMPSVLISILERGVCPPEHIAQVQGGMSVLGRPWTDVMIGYPKMPHLIVRVNRDIEYIGKLSRALAEFKADLDALVAKLRKMPR